MDVFHHCSHKKKMTYLFKGSRHHVDNATVLHDTLIEKKFTLLNSRGLYKHKPSILKNNILKIRGSLINGPSSRRFKQIHYACIPIITNVYRIVPPINWL